MSPCYSAVYIAVLCRLFFFFLFFLFYFILFFGLSCCAVRVYHLSRAGSTKGRASTYASCTQATRIPGRFTRGQEDQHGSNGPMVHTGTETDWLTRPTHRGPRGQRWTPGSRTQRSTMSTGGKADSSTTSPGSRDAATASCKATDSSPHQRRRRARR